VPVHHLRSSGHSGSIQAILDVSDRFRRIGFTGETGRLREFPTAPLDGKFILVITSWSKNHNNEPFAMKSITNHNDIESLYHATPLTIEILKKAIIWIQGTNTGEPIPSFESIEDGLKIYLKMLSTSIPLQPSATDLPADFMKRVYDFIKDHEWDDEIDVDTLMNKIRINLDWVNTDSDCYESLCYKSRHFLNVNVAKQTCVVAQCVEGNHRLISAESVLNGYRVNEWDEEEEQSLTSYHERLPHSKTMIDSKVILLTDKHVKEEEAFTAAMKGLSSRTQKTIGCSQPLGRKVFLKSMIELLHKNCQTNDVDFIENAQDAQESESLLEEIMNEISSTLCSDEAKGFYEIVPTMMLNDSIKNSMWQSFFKKKKSLSDDYVYDQCFLCTTNKFTALHIIRKFGSLYHQNRYQTSEAEFFELLLILVWSRLSKDTYNHILMLFSRDCQNNQISTSDGHLVNKWLTCMIVNVFSSVYYSAKVIWKAKSAEITKQKKKCDPTKRYDVYRIQLMKAIATQTVYFSLWGPNPQLPQWFENAVSSKVKNHMYVLEEYTKLIVKEEFDENDESVAIKKDFIMKMIQSDHWELVDFFFSVTVAYSLHMKDISKKDISEFLEDYCKSLEDWEKKIREDFIYNDTFVSKVTSTFLEFFVPDKPTFYDSDEVEEVFHKTPTMAMYKSIEKVVASFKDEKIRTELMQMGLNTATHLEKAQIKRLLTLIQDVDLQLFSHCGEHLNSGDINNDDNEKIDSDGNYDNNDIVL
jgi:hypothetical protein